jgi:hypothetical protein
MTWRRVKTTVVMLSVVLLNDMLCIILQNDMALLKHDITVVILQNDVAPSKDYCRYTECHFAQ